MPGFHTGFLAWGGEKSIGASTKRGNVRGLGVSSLPGSPENFEDLASIAKSDKFNQHLDTSLL